MDLTITAVLYSTFLWWFSTGVIFYLNARPSRTFRLSMLVGSALLVGAVYGFWVSASMETVAGAYIAFSCGLLIWGWHTMSYYMGVITGPQRESCPENCGGLERFLLAIGTSLYHEIAIIATAIGLAWITWNEPNTIGLWTFVLLWGMHVSAKLNVFLGVRNLNVEFIPKRLRYLSTFFKEKPMNLLFPISVTAGTIITVALIQQASAADADTMAAAGYVLMATLMALAVIEHWFMILPIPAEALWKWSIKQSGSDPEDSLKPDAVQTIRRDSASVNETRASAHKDTGTISASSESAKA